MLVALKKIHVVVFGFFSIDVVVVVVVVVVNNMCVVCYN